MKLTRTKEILNTTFNYIPAELQSKMLANGVRLSADNLIKVHQARIWLDEKAAHHWVMIYNENVASSYHIYFESEEDMALFLIGFV